MPQPLPQQPGKPGGVPPKPVAPQLPKKDLSAFDRFGRTNLSKRELTQEIMKLPSAYVGKTYSKADKLKIVDEIMKETGGSYITKANLPYLKKKLALGSSYGPDAGKKAENRRRLDMIQKIFGNQ